MRPSAFLVAVLAGICVGCDVPTPPTAEDTAAYLGMSDGKVFTYQSDVTETLEVKTSSLVENDALFFDLTARANGFVVDDRTFTVKLDAESVQIVRFFDCTSLCGQPSAPVDMFEVPLDDGGQTQTAVDIVINRNGIDESPVAETHTFLVAETDGGFTVSWTRAGAETGTSILTIVPDTGIVKWQGFDGKTLELVDD